MIQKRLRKAVLRRLKELGLPPSLIDMDGFRESFLLNKWVMYVRDRDAVADVHLIQPRHAIKPLGAKRIRSRTGGRKT